jgi:hypothetical protein
MVSLALVAASLTIGLLLLVSKGNGATSLDDLRSEVDQAQSYRGELQGYVKSHNITALNGIQLSTPQLEQIVKSHIYSCKVGLYVDGDC